MATYNKRGFKSPKEKEVKSDNNFKFIDKLFYQETKKYTQCIWYDDYILSMLPSICK